MPQSLDRLTKQEVNLLMLLAQGHTAKTIANLTGLTVNVVNERLRSARRKADAPSSRELARLIAARNNEPPQENWDKVIGVEPVSGVMHPNRARRLAMNVRALRADWGLTMIAAILTAGTLLIFQSGSPSLMGRDSTSPIQTDAGGFTRLDTVGDATYLLDGSVVRGSRLHQGTLVTPLGERGVASVRIEVDCVAKKWRAITISFYNQDGTPRRSTDMGPSSGWSTRNAQGITEPFCT